MYITIIRSSSGNILSWSGWWWIQSLTREHREEGRNTSWMGCQSITRHTLRHTFPPRGNLASPIHLGSCKKKKKDHVSVILLYRKHGPLARKWLSDVIVTRPRGYCWIVSQQEPRPSDGLKLCRAQVNGYTPHWSGWEANTCHLFRVLAWSNVYAVGIWY